MATECPTDDALFNSFNRTRRYSIWLRFPSKPIGPTAPNLSLVHSI